MTVLVCTVCLDISYAHACMDAYAHVYTHFHMHVHARVCTHVFTHAQAPGIAELFGKLDRCIAPLLFLERVLNQNTGLIFALQFNL